MDLLEKEVEIVCKNPKCEDFDKIHKAHLLDFVQGFAGRISVIAVPEMHCKKCFDMLQVTVK
jgi:hypothetical protein